MRSLLFPMKEAYRIAPHRYEEDLLRIQMAAKHLPIAISSFTEGENYGQATKLVREFLQQTAAYHAALLKRTASWLRQQVLMSLLRSDRKQLTG